jgi:hypothetical protein
MPQASLLIALLLIFAKSKTFVVKTALDDFVERAGLDLARHGIDVHIAGAAVEQERVAEFPLTHCGLVAPKRACNSAGPVVMSARAGASIRDALSISP